VAVHPKGCGDVQDPLHMMRALLICGYANGIVSSWGIERATCRDIARARRADGVVDFAGRGRYFRARCKSSGQGEPPASEWRQAIPDRR